MRDIPALLSGYTLMVTAEPEGKEKELEDGTKVPVTDREGVQTFSVLLLAKAKREAGEQVRKDGEEIKVNLPSDPGEGFEPGTFVELINPVINTFEMRDPENPRAITNAGIWWKADGLKPAAPTRTTKRSGGDPKSTGDASADKAA